jgi:hypothetical protein
VVCHGTQSGFQAVLRGLTGARAVRGAVPPPERGRPPAGPTAPPPPPSSFSCLLLCGGDMELEGGRGPRWFSAACCMPWRRSAWSRGELLLTLPAPIPASLAALLELLLLLRSGCAVAGLSGRTKSYVASVAVVTSLPPLSPPPALPATATALPPLPSLPRPKKRANRLGLLLPLRCRPLLPADRSPASICCSTAGLAGWPTAAKPTVLLGGVARCGEVPLPQPASENGGLEGLPLLPPLSPCGGGLKLPSWPTAAGAGAAPPLHPLLPLRLEAASGPCPVS